MNFNGVSKISISNEAISHLYDRLMNNASAQYRITVKYDNRPNIVSTFARLFKRGQDVEIRFYTSAVLDRWDEIFMTKDGVSTPAHVLIFLLIFLIKKTYAAGTQDVSFDMKVSMFNTYRQDMDFEDVRAHLAELLEVYEAAIQSFPKLDVGNALDLSIKKPYPEIPEEG